MLDECIYFMTIMEHIGTIKVKIIFNNQFVTCKW